MADEQFAAPYDTGAAPRSASPPGKSLPARAVDAVRGHPAAALAVIVVLAVLVLFFYAQKQGWFGLGGGKAAMRSAPRRSAARGKKQAADSDSDPETEDLIDSINRSG